MDRRIPAPLAAALVLAALHTPALAQDARHYVNARFGFSVDIPAGFVAGEPPANGDGLRFTSADGEAAITASAIRNVGGGTMAAFAAMSNDACVGHRPSYLTVHADWAVLSCPMPDGRILYERSALRGRGEDGVFTTVHATYPAASHARWDPVAAATARSMKPAPGG